MSLSFKLNCENFIIDTYKNFDYEWIITNGLGGFASGTPMLCNARKYHGLLVAAFNPPADRYLVLSKIDEEITRDNEEYFLAVNQYEKVFQPTGFRYLKTFEQIPEPVFTYSVNDITLTKKIFMVYGQNTVVIKYEVISAVRPFTLKMYPLTNFRDFHGNTSAKNPGFKYDINHKDKNLNIIFSDNALGAKNLYMTSDKAIFKRNENWHRDFLLYEEVLRGEEAKEDLFSPGRYSITLKAGDVFYLYASTDFEKPAESLKKLEKKSAERAAKIIKSSPVDNDFARKLSYSADSFIVSRRSTGKKTVIAGYHWFSDWGRDTMIALPGLTLINKRFDVCREILETFSENIKNGLVPNRFPDNSEMPVEYNTVDASLWYFNAIYKYYQYTDDIEFVKKLMPGMRNIIENYMSGTDYNIKMDHSDGFIMQGAEGYQLTWMDAKVNGFVVTPRTGKPVEINALWYNALCVYKFFFNVVCSEMPFEYDELIKKVLSNFSKFINPENGSLYDFLLNSPENGSCVSEESKKIRPNQIFAVSLPFSPLTQEIAEKIMKIAAENLLTPYGLRSLAPSDKDYKGIYDGDRYKRDCSYHQGTTWGYLIGPYISASLRTAKYSRHSVNECRELLNAMEKHLDCEGIFSVSEIFDGDAPYKPCGCIS